MYTVIKLALIAIIFCQNDIVARRTVTCNVFLGVPRMEHMEQAAEASVVGQSNVLLNRYDLL